MQYRVKITWDEEAHVWIAISEDLKGLVLECGSLDALIERTKIVASELLEIQGKPRENVSLNFSMERHLAVA